MKLRNKIPELLDTDPAKFARKLDVSNWTAYKYAGNDAVKYFDDNSSVSIGTLIKIANVLGVPFFDLFEQVE